MKYLITESQNDKVVDRLTNGVKYNGWKETTKLVGGDENLIKLLRITSPMDFLHLFDDLDVVQGEQKPELTLFRYMPGRNLIIHEVENVLVYVNHEEIFGILEDVFGLSYPETQKLIKVWISDVYNIREFGPSRIFSSYYNQSIMSTI